MSALQGVGLFALGFAMCGVAVALMIWWSNRVDSDWFDRYDEAIVRKYARQASRECQYDDFEHLMAIADRIRDVA